MAAELLDDAKWQRKTLEKLLLSVLKEQQLHRRWGILFKLLFCVGFFWLLFSFWPNPLSFMSATQKAKRHISLVEIRGVIGDGNPSSAENVTMGLQNAFEDKSTSAVVLRINSPGGSPVQAAQIYEEIRYLREKHPKIRLLAVCDDVCASAAYYVAAASDDIYASPASLVGSIGVLMDGFGFVDSLKKLGMERRLLASGNHKGFLDPFLPLKASDVQIARRLLTNVHQQFIQAVVQGRGRRLWHALSKQKRELFSGLAWTGQQAKPLGLIDGFGNLNTVARDIIKNETIVDYTVRPSMLQQLMDSIGAFFTQRFGSQLGFWGVRACKGFSLLELMLVLAITGILITIAYPAYSGYLVKTHRVEGRIALLALASRLEQYALENSSGYEKVSLEKLGTLSETEHGWYRLDILEAQKDRYALAATPNFHDPVCTQLQLNQLGEQSSEGTGSSAECWGEA